MNDHILSLYVLPVDPKSKWFYLIEASDADSLQKALVKRAIHEPAFFTVYADPNNWLTVGHNKHRSFDAINIQSHIISDKRASLIYSTAYNVRESHFNFKGDFKKLRDRYFPIAENKPRTHLVLV